MRQFKIKTVKVKGVRCGQLGIFEGYRRWRHTRGYGVHSPYAFNLVTSVVHPGDYSWYGYSDIDRTFPEVVDRKVRREARMLLRLVAELRPRSVFLPSGAHPSFHAAIHAAGSSIQILRKPKQAAEADMICTHGNFIPLDIILAHISRPGRSRPHLRGTRGGSTRERMPQYLRHGARRNAETAIHDENLKKKARSSNNAAGYRRLLPAPGA